MHVPERLEHHAEIVRILTHGKIISAERNRPSQFGHESYILQASARNKHFVPGGGLDLKFAPFGYFFMLIACTSSTHKEGRQPSLS